MNSPYDVSDQENVSLTTNQALAQVIKRLPDARQVVFRAGLFVVINLLILLLFHQMMNRGGIRVPSWIAALIALGMIPSSLLVALYQWIYWQRPARRIAALLPQVRQGEAPIDDLNEIRGPLKPLVMEIQETLREIRRQRAEIGRMEAEIRQRLANRTDALERSLGIMRQKATRDPLTGLLNRRSLDEALPQVMQCARNERSPLTVMMCDVDNFKPLNDVLGHAAGDEFLRFLGQIFRSSLRETDQAFRYGGDEFVLVLPSTEREQADVIAQRLTETVDAMTRTLLVPRRPGLSIGVLSMAQPPFTTEELLRDVDRLLYEIKAVRKAKARTEGRTASSMR